MSTNKLIPSSSEATDTTIEQQSPLSIAERNELAQCEEQVAFSMVQAAMALKTIRDKRLYRTEFCDWETYVRERWGHSKSYSYQLISFADMYEVISANEKSANGRLLLPTSERQVRPLAKLGDDEKILAAWLEATERSDGKLPAGVLVEEVVAEMMGTDRKTRKQKVPTDSTGADEAEQQEDALDADDAIMDTSDVPPQDAQGNALDDDDVVSKEENPDWTDNIAESMCIEFIDSMIPSPDGDADEDEAVPTVPLTLTPGRRKVMGNTKRAHELAVAFRDAISDEVDAEVAARIYEAVQQILSEMPQAA